MSNQKLTPRALRDKYELDTSNKVVSPLHTFDVLLDDDTEEYLVRLRNYITWLEYQLIEKS